MLHVRETTPSLFDQVRDNVQRLMRSASDALLSGSPKTYSDMDRIARPVKRMPRRRNTAAFGAGSMQSQLVALICVDAPVNVGMKEWLTEWGAAVDVENIYEAEELYGLNLDLYDFVVLAGGFSTRSKVNVEKVSRTIRHIHPDLPIIHAVNEKAAVGGSARRIPTSGAALGLPATSTALALTLGAPNGDVPAEKAGLLV